MGDLTSTITVTRLRLKKFVSELDKHQGQVLGWKAATAPRLLEMPILLGSERQSSAIQASWEACYQKASEPRENVKEVVIGLPNTMFIGQALTPSTIDGKILASTMRVKKFLTGRETLPDGQLSLPVATEIMKLKGPIASVGPVEFNNFYHWMTEGLPKLHAIRRSYSDEALRLLIPRGYKKFIPESISLIGMSPNKIYEANPARRYQAEYGIFATSPARSIVCLSESVYDFYNETTDRLDVPLGNTACENFLVSRAGGFRSILNEGELLEQLGPSYMSIRLEELSLVEQITLFKRAKRIVAPHGAGLTLLLAANPKVSVVEIIPSYLTAPSSYWAISQNRSLRYAAALCAAGELNSPFMVDRATIQDIISFMRQ